MGESAHVQCGCQREHDGISPLHSQHRTLQILPALPGRRDIVAMAISEAGSPLSFGGAGCVKAEDMGGKW